MDGRDWKVAGVTVAIGVAALGLGGLAFMYSGAYNVAATAEHTPVVRWALQTTQARSVKARGDRAPKAPPFDSALVVSGFDGFRDMCVECHGAPGVDPGVTGQGLNPEPPELSEEAEEMSDGELFWVTKHGVKFTGMPAFGLTHSDEDIWALVAFMRELQEMTPEEYARRVAEREAALEAQGSEGGHSHAPGTAEHSH
jgi:mono/diheme cytochrome c family protein